MITSRCISYYSYIKPQLQYRNGREYLCCISYYSYIKPQHWSRYHPRPRSCISYYSYIKPQPQRSIGARGLGCISYYSYIKPQRYGEALQLSLVVYRTIPTSNHNSKLPTTVCTSLYIVLFLHQTTTWLQDKQNTLRLYIVLFLHQTTTTARWWSRSIALYIVLFLHQTTTLPNLNVSSLCCISYYSYIKPQLYVRDLIDEVRCISYYSYIKPQQSDGMTASCTVVYRTIPTSNHNL